MNVTIPTSPEEAVANGVRLLDEHRPGWRDLVNADYLRMASCRYCVIGQVFESEIDTAFDEDGYNHGLAVLGVEHSAHLAGFDTSVYRPWSHSDLQRLWLRELDR